MKERSNLTIRRPGIAFPEHLDSMLVEGQPELTCLLIALSLSAPYLESYLIQTMSRARRLITDPALREAITLLNGQEAQHLRLHRRFNQVIGVGCPALAELEAELERDFKRSHDARSLRWNLAYIEGVEAMTTAVSRFLLEEQVWLKVAPAVRDLLEWHMLEELEHRAVTFDTYAHLYGRDYLYRVAVHARAQRDLGRFTLRAMAVLLERVRAAGRDPASSAERWSRARAFAAQIGRGLLPKVVGTFAPGYTPHQIEMPPGAELALRRFAEWNPGAAREPSEPAAALPTAA